jgi:hypothetical protein
MDTTTKKQDLEDEAGDAEAENEGMTEEALEELLTQALEDFADENDEVPRLRIRTFEEAGVLTRNRGLVLRIDDAEFQVQVVRSR